MHRPSRPTHFARLALVVFALSGCLSFPATEACKMDTDCPTPEACDLTSGRCVSRTGADAGPGADLGPRTDGGRGGANGDASSGGATGDALNGGSPADATLPVDAVSPPPDGAPPPPVLRWRQVSAGGSVADPGVSSGYETGHGNGHTCGITMDAALYCWGSNGDGQLGVGEDAGTRFAVPQAVEPGTRWASVSAGLVHTCAIRAADDPDLPGTLFCWGNPDWGRLGVENADLADTARPRQVGRAADWRQVSAGGGHTCGIRGATGELYCWGAHHNGQLGQSPDPGQMSSVLPLRLPGDGYEKVSASLLHSCGLRTGGHLDCWGMAVYGRTGHGEVEPSVCDSGEPCIPAPREISVVRNWRDVATGDGHSCALDDEGRVWCWGANYEFAAGLANDVEYTATPTEVADQVSALDAGGLTTCVRGAEFSWCFGLGASGQRGSGFPDAPSLEYVRGPITAPPGEAWASVGVGGEHTCMLTETGQLYCFGSTYDGQVGAGRFSGSPVPTPSPFRGPIDRLAVGYERSACALSEGDVYCWGDGTAGLFLDADLPSSGLPVRLTTSGDFFELAVGMDFACAQREAEGAVETLCWGRGDSGQLGDGGGRDTDGEMSLVPRAMTGAVRGSLSAAVGHACRASGEPGGRISAECWGRSSEGQLGPQAEGLGPWAPTRLTGEETLTRLAVGDVSTFGILESGALVRWGAIRSLFDPPDPAEFERLLTPVPLGVFTDWLEISAARDRFCGIRAGDGPQARILFCADVAALDDRTLAARQALDGLPQGRPGPFTTVVAGAYDVFALDDQGRLFSTGNNLFGQTGDGRRYTREAHELQQIAPALRFTAVAAGDGFACGVTQGDGELDRRLHCWGRGHRGQTALGTADPSLPQRVLDP